MKYLTTILAMFLLSSVTVTADDTSGECGSRYKVEIGKLENVALASVFEVPVTLTQYDRIEGMSGFELTIVFNNDGIQFLDAKPGEIFRSGSWQYFAYRTGNNAPFDDPKGIVHISGFAGGFVGPQPWGSKGEEDDADYGLGVPTTLATLRFHATDDRTYECQYVPIRFYWNGCQDNTVWNRRFSEVFSSDTVFDYSSSNPINDGSVGFPTYRGAQDECLENAFPYPLIPTRRVDFENGGVDLLCDEWIDYRGDINVNGVAYEPTDIFLFIGYFMYGLSVFENPNASVAASDVNADGLTLTVPDLVYLVRVFDRDAQPYPNIMPSPNEFVVTQNAGNHTIEFTTEDTLGAMVLSFDGEVTADSTQHGFVAVDAYHPADGQTRVVIYSLRHGKSLKSGVALRYSGEGELIDVATATYEGQPVNTTMDSPTAVEEQRSDELPTDFALSQNYPNPFNPTTTIEFALPAATQVQIWVYNVTGQRVRTLTNQLLPAGYHSIVWDGTNDGGHEVSSGVYFYRIEAGDFIQSKKMILMK